MRNNFLLLFLTCLMLVSCARQDYRRAAPNLHLVTKERLAVGVQDQRPSILNHSTNENFVGVQRTYQGLSVGAITESTRPLAEDMADALVNGLSKSGATIMPIKIAPAMSRNEILQLAQSQQSEKIIYLTLLNWSTDTLNSTDLNYDLLLTVLSSQGHELATKRVRGTDNLGLGFPNPQSVPVKLAPIAFQQKLEALFGGDISAALSQSQHSPLSAISIPTKQAMPPKLSTLAQNNLTESRMRELNMDCRDSTDCKQRELNMNCRDKSDCRDGFNCRTSKEGGTECRAYDIQQLSTGQAKTAEQSTQSTPSAIAQPYEQPSPRKSASDEYIEVKTTKSGGVYLIPVLINDVLQMKFIIDSGSADVSISPDVFLTLIKTETIEKRDWLPGQRYQLADGSIAQSNRFKIRTLKIGSRILKNVVCSISESIDAPMLLGQSALEQLVNFSFHPETGTVRFNK